MTFPTQAQIDAEIMARKNAATCIALKEDNVSLVLTLHHICAAPVYETAKYIVEIMSIPDTDIDGMTNWICSTGREIKAEIEVARNKKDKSKGSFYLSLKWRKLRYDFIRENGGRCSCCGRTAKDGVTIHVDHIKPRSKYPHLALVKDNLQIFCDDCNIGKSNTDEIDWNA